MAKLYFYYSAMNAGKSTLLLQSAYNYHERGMQTLCLTPSVDDRFGQGMIASRIGLQTEATIFEPDTDLFKLISASPPVHCILVDEAHFTTRAQIKQLCRVVDELDIPTLCYGLRTNYMGECFEGSITLLGWADVLSEVKTICHCGRKATHVLRIGEDGKVIAEGKSTVIGGNEMFTSVCRKHFVGQVCA